jgi:hypothetical protein
LWTWFGPFQGSALRPFFCGPLSLAHLLTYLNLSTSGPHQPFSSWNCDIPFNSNPAWKRIWMILNYTSFQPCAADHTNNDSLYGYEWSVRRWGKCFRITWLKLFWNDWEDHVANTSYAPDGAWGSGSWTRVFWLLRSRPMFRALPVDLVR